LTSNDDSKKRRSTKQKSRHDCFKSKNLGKTVALKLFEIHMNLDFFKLKGFYLSGKKEDSICQKL
jgi:hypothetical protein